MRLQTALLVCILAQCALAIRNPEADAGGPGFAAPCSEGALPAARQGLFLHLSGYSTNAGGSGARPAQKCS